ncbi:MAG TPA: RCC1 domain-containing protein, partial [Enhygromyxa sp.]|nr:RCC1 domain-containing protein [Enhygromyxa sp.]
GIDFMCARLAGGSVRCWGWGFGGLLGNNSTISIGANPGEMPAPNVALGGPAVQLSVGDTHSCALMASGALRCWGQGGAQLGYGHVNNIGDSFNEMPSAPVPVW